MANFSPFNKSHLASNVPPLSPPPGLSSAKKPFVFDPTKKKYRMSPSQWSCSIRNAIVLFLCDKCLSTFRNSLGLPNLLYLACDDCVRFNHLVRFPNDKPLQPFSPPLPPDDKTNDQ